MTKIQHVKEKKEKLTNENWHNQIGLKPSIIIFIKKKLVKLTEIE